MWFRCTSLWLPLQQIVPKGKLQRGTKEVTMWACFITFWKDSQSLSYYPRRGCHDQNPSNLADVWCCMEGQSVPHQLLLPKNLSKRLHDHQKSDISSDFEWSIPETWIPQATQWRAFNHPVPEMIPLAIEFRPPSSMLSLPRQVSVLKAYNCLQDRQKVAWGQSYLAQNKRYSILVVQDTIQVLAMLSVDIWRRKIEQKGGWRIRNLEVVELTASPSLITTFPSLSE